MMKIACVVLVCFSVVVLAKPPQQKRKEYDYDFDFTAPAPAASASINHYEGYVGHSAPSSSGSKKGYSVGSGLRSIAQGSADQANTAVFNQHAAGKQAAYVAKNTLAQAAAQASATAQAALAGKEVIVSGLEQQVRDAKVALDGESTQLQSANRAAAAAAAAAQQSVHQVNVIQAALNQAQATAEHAAQSAADAAGEAASQLAMVGQAKQRLAALSDQLHGAQIDLEATQAAAFNAQSAAQTAQNNAANAAAKAAIAAAAIEPKGHSEPAPVAPSAGGHGASSGSGAAHYDDYSQLGASDDGRVEYGYKASSSFQY